jgi:hypothetical protein
VRTSWSYGLHFAPEDSSTQERRSITSSKAPNKAPWLKHRVLPEHPMNNLKGGRLRLPLKFKLTLEFSTCLKAPLGCSNSPRIVDPLEDCQEATDLTPTERSQPIYETCPQRKSTVSLRSWSCDFPTTTHIPEDGVPLNSTTTNFSSTTLSNLGTRLF